MKLKSSEVGYSVVNSIAWNVGVAIPRQASFVKAAVTEQELWLCYLVSFAFRPPFEKCFSNDFFDSAKKQSLSFDSAFCELRCVLCRKER